MQASAESKRATALASELRHLAHGAGLRIEVLGRAPLVRKSKAVITHVQRLGLSKADADEASLAVLTCYANWRTKLGDHATLLCNAFNLANEHSTLTTRRYNYMETKRIGKKKYAKWEAEAFNALATLLLTEDAFPCGGESDAQIAKRAASQQWKLRMRMARHHIELAILQLEEVSDTETAKQAVRRLVAMMPNLARLMISDGAINLSSATALIAGCISRYYAEAMQSVHNLRSDIPLADAESAMTLIGSLLHIPGTPGVARTSDAIEAVEISGIRIRAEDLRNATTSGLGQLTSALPMDAPEVLRYAKVQTIALVCQILSSVETLDLWAHVSPVQGDPGLSLPWLADAFEPAGTF